MWRPDGGLGAGVAALRRDPSSAQDADGSGVSLGSGVSPPDGLADGAAVGDTLGATDGAALGDADGAALGATLADADGCGAIVGP